MLRIAHVCRTWFQKDFWPHHLDWASPGRREAWRSQLFFSVLQLQNQSELRAPTAEKAAFFLDAAIASRRSNQQDCDEDDHRNSHMLFTLHIYQYRMEKSGKGGSKSILAGSVMALAS